MTYYDLIDTPIGELLLTGDGQNLTGIYMENHKGGPGVAADWIRDSGPFESAKRQLIAYFEGRASTFDFPLAFEGGTPFQRSVWERLTRIPFGETTTYGEIAHELGHPKASRAVGSAVGRNPISIVVPCHRVLGSGGTITGYAGGVDRKRKLLKIENVLPTSPV